MYNLEDYIQCSLSIHCLRKLSELLQTQLPCSWFLLCVCSPFVFMVLSSPCGEVFSLLHWEMLKI